MSGKPESSPMPLGLWALWALWVAGSAANNMLDGRWGFAFLGVAILAIGLRLFIDGVRRR